jgi:hypothetical protein
MNEHRHKILVALIFIMAMQKSDCTSDCIAMRSYWTTLEHDECNVVFIVFVDMASRICNM